MKAFSCLAAVLCSLSTTAFATKSFLASNLYYAAGLKDSQSTTLLDGLNNASVKVLRVWLDGQSGNTKGTEIDSFPGIQGDSPSTYDDTVLNRLDSFMVKAHSYGIKLSIPIHSYNALEGNNDFYGKYYGTGDFYTNTNAISQFKDRIAHVLAHVNPTNGKTWGQSSEYIFAFEAQNEAMHANGNPTALASWQCIMAKAIEDNMQNNANILVTTGGGSCLATSAQDPYFSCSSLDVIAIHAYGNGGKKLIMQEWGACYTDASNNNCNGGLALSPGTRDNSIRTWASQINAAGIPWFYWQILPSADPHNGWDYEVGINDVNWSALKAAGLAAGQADSAFDFSKWLL